MLACVVDIARRVVTPRATRAGTCGYRLLLVLCQWVFILPLCGPARKTSRIQTRSLSTAHTQSPRKRRVGGQITSQPEDMSIHLINSHIDSLPKMCFNLYHIAVLTPESSQLKAPWQGEVAS